jgi:hypothetical protein
MRQRIDQARNTQRGLRQDHRPTLGSLHVGDERRVSR